MFVKDILVRVVGARNNEIYSFLPTKNEAINPNKLKSLIASLLNFLTASLLLSTVSLKLYICALPFIQ